MTVTMLDPIQVSENAWLLRWLSSLSDPTYRVYRAGKLIATTKIGTIVVSIPARTFADIEVLDDADAVPETLPSGLVTLQWGVVAGAASYRVDELVGAAWVSRGVVFDDGRPTQSFETTPISDGTTGTFRVVPVGVNGNEATPTQKAIAMVRSPDPPMESGAVVQTYDSGTGQVTFSTA